VDSLGNQFNQFGQLLFRPIPACFTKYTSDIDIVNFCDVFYIIILELQVSSKLSGGSGQIEKEANRKN
jgi:hypothetical protein